MPWCSEDTVTFWVDKDGKIRIYAKENPDNLLFETNNKGKLQSKRPEDLEGVSGEEVYMDIPRCFDADVMTLFSRFESENNTFIFRNKEGSIRKVSFPGILDTSGKELCLIADGDPPNQNFYLESNPKFRLIAYPSFLPDLAEIGNKGANLSREFTGNPIGAIDNVLWFASTGEKANGIYKVYIPPRWRERPHGATHRFRAGVAAPVSFFYNSRDFVGPTLRPMDTLGALRLAEKFQQIGEYERAIGVLRSLATPIAIENYHETVELQTILDRGLQSPRSAAVAAIAILQIFRSDILQYAHKTSGNKRLAGIFIGIFDCTMGGIDGMNSEIWLPMKEEYSLWDNVLQFAAAIGYFERGEIVYGTDGKMCSKENSGPAHRLLGRMDDLRSLTAIQDDDAARATLRDSFVSGGDRIITSRREDLWREDLSRREIVFSFNLYPIPLDEKLEISSFETSIGGGITKEFRENFR
jgi:hypothetical protein